MARALERAAAATSASLIPGAHERPGALGETIALEKIITYPPASLTSTIPEDNPTLNMMLNETVRATVGGDVGDSERAGAGP